MDAVLLYNQGYGTTQIASILSCHRSTVRRKLLKNGVVLRKKSPQKNYNIKAFSSFTEKSCYWAGFIAADGNVRSNRDAVQIHLSKIDLNHLEKFKDFIRLDGNIGVYENSCKVSVNGRWFVQDLKENFNITNRKSLTLKPPKLPQYLLRHYFRGYFDGDGSITKTSTPSMSLIGTIDMLNSFNEYAHSLGVSLKSKNAVAPLIPAGNAFQISYSGINAYKILSHLYDDSAVCLDRKKNKFDFLFAKYKGLK